MAVYKRGKGWAYKLYYTSDGKQKTVSKSGFRTKAEANDAYILRQNDLLLGKSFDKGNILLADYMRSWKKLYKDGTISSSSERTINMIINYIDKHYNIELNKITHDNYQEYLNKLASKLSKSTVSKYNTYTKAAIKHAVKTRILLFNPTDGAIVKGDDSNVYTEDTKYLSKSEFNSLYHALMNGINPSYPARYMILLAMFTGMRVGECLALTWDSIDRENNTIKIDKGFDYQYTHDFTDGKTKSAKRTIVVPLFIIDLLLELPKEHERVFTLASLTAIRKALKKALESAKINRHIRFHSLRHTHASILLSEGVQVLTISKRLGHADPTITMNTYAHIIKELQESEDKKVISILTDGTTTER